MDASPLVSVLIVNYNGGPYLLDAVRSALASSVPVEVLVVDNASRDGSLRLLRRASGDDARLRIIENARNLGFARANNQAFEQVRGDYVLLLNPDTTLAPDTLERMLEVMAAHPQAGMAGCLIRNPDGSEQAGCRRTIPTPWTGLIRALHLQRWRPARTRMPQVDLLHQPLPEGPVPVEAISGAFMLVRREALEAVGPMDEGYFLHCEDLDWCRTFTDSGWEVLFVPQVSIVHHKGMCSQRRPLFVLWHKHRGMVRFYRKHLAHRYGRAVQALVTFGVWARFLAAAPLAWWRGRGGREAEAPLAVPPPPAVADAPELGALAGRRVLVTGGTGFIGRHLVGELLRLGARVRVLSRRAEGVSALWGGRVEAVGGDLERADSLQGACTGMDLVFHLASHAHMLDQSADPADRHHRVTVQGTLNLLAAAEAAAVQGFLFVSTVKAMGEEDDRCLDESSPPRPESPYGKAKLEAERAVLEVGDRLHWQAAVLRLPMVYGPGNKGNLPRMIQAIGQGRFPPLPEFGNRRSMVHVEDAVRALLLCAVRPEARGQVYIVTDGRDYSSRELYDLIRRALGLGAPRWEVPLGLLRVGALGGDALAALGLNLPLNSANLRKLRGSAWYCSARIHRELGFRPAHDLEENLPAILAGMRAAGSAPPQEEAAQPPQGEAGSQGEEGVPRKT